MALALPALAPAQNLREAATPAEFPPASFTGNQYVDSRGCVYIRAGIDGNTTWVPRVDRERNVLCGAQPTFGGARPQVVAAPRPAGPPPEEITLAPQARPAPAPAPAAPAAEPAPRPAAAPQRVTAAAAPRPMPPKVKAAAPAVSIQRVQRPAPQPAEAAPPPAKVAVRRAEAATIRCPNASTFSQQFINDGSRYPVRCGPQAEPPVTSRPYTGHAGRDGVLRVSEKARIVPRHVYVDNWATTSVTVPEGYRRVWEDDRLNPYRAWQTPEGHRQSAYLWTRDVPRRLVDPTPPHEGYRPPRLVPESAVNVKPAPPAPPVTRAAPAQLSTRSAPAAAAGRYVQVATFGVEANAMATARQLSRAGLPVRVGAMNRGGKPYRLVMIGPLADAASVNAALARARAAGFSDAFVR